ncbi:MAG: AAA family ATPase [Lachnospiraceae bacterium]|jgi:cytidylate kinase
MLLSINSLYGSGGNEIAFALGERLGYTIYDGELTAQAVAESGVDMLTSTLDFYDENMEILNEKNKSKPYSRALMKLELDVLPIAFTEHITGVNTHGSSVLSQYMDSAPINFSEGNAIKQKNDIERIKFAQAHAILNAAEKGNSIFIGRSSSYVLDGRDDTLRFFFTASMESCERRIADKYGFDNPKEATRLIRRTNYRRAYFFETFTGLKWGEPINYDYCINTDRVSCDKIVDLIVRLVEG